jgi:hypothetical protein
VGEEASPVRFVCVGFEDVVDRSGLRRQALHDSWRGVGA